MSIKASVKKGFGVMRQSLPVVGVLSLFGFSWNLLNIYLAPKLQSPSTKVTVFMFAASTVFILISIFLQAGSLGYVRDILKQGKAGFSSFMSAGSKYYLRLLLVGLVISLVAILFVIAGGLFVALLKKIGIVIAVLIAAVGIYVILLMFFAPYMVVADEGKARASIKKSISMVSKDMNFFIGVLLTALSVFVAVAYLFKSFRKSKLGRKNLVKVIVLVMTLVSIGFVIGLLIGGLFGISNIVAPGMVSQVILAVLSSILNAFLGIFVTASFMNFYFEISNK